MFEFVDRLAEWWLDVRLQWAVNHNPTLADFRLKEVEIGQGFTKILIEHPMVTILAGEADKILSKSKAQNYFQFELLPRLNQDLRPIEVTLRWADSGLSPAQKNAQLKAKIEDLKPFVFKVMGTYIGGGKMQFRELCQACGTTFTRGDEQHQGNCVFAKENHA